jgi:hypothetical protein
MVTLMPMRSSNTSASFRFILWRKRVYQHYCHYVVIPGVAETEYVFRRLIYGASAFAYPDSVS